MRLLDKKRARESSSLDIKVPHGDKLTTPPKNAASTGTSSSQQAKMTDEELIQALYDDPQLASALHKQRRRNAQQQKKKKKKKKHQPPKMSSDGTTTNGKNGGPRMSALFGNSYRSNQDAIPVTQWIVLLLLLGAGMWQFRKTISSTSTSSSKNNQKKKDRSHRGNYTKIYKPSFKKKNGKGSKRHHNANKQRQMKPQAVPATQENNQEALMEAEMLSREIQTNATASKKKSKKPKKKSSSKKNKNGHKQQQQQQISQEEVVSDDEEEDDDVDKNKDKNNAPALANHDSIPESSLTETPVIDQIMLTFDNNDDEEDGAEWNTVGKKSNKAPKNTTALPSSLPDKDGASTTPDATDVTPATSNSEEEQEPLDAEDPIIIPDHNTESSSNKPTTLHVAGVSNKTSSDEPAKNTTRTPNTKSGKDTPNGKSTANVTHTTTESTSTPSNDETSPSTPLENGIENTNKDNNDDVAQMDKPNLPSKESKQTNESSPAKHIVDNNGTKPDSSTRNEKSSAPPAVADIAKVESESAAAPDSEEGRAAALNAKENIATAPTIQRGTSAPDTADDEEIAKQLQKEEERLAELDNRRVTNTTVVDDGWEQVPSKKKKNH